MNSQGNYIIHGCIQLSSDELVVAHVFDATRLKRTGTSLNLPSIGA